MMLGGSHPSLLLSGWNPTRVTPVQANGTRLEIDSMGRGQDTANEEAEVPLPTS